MSHPTPLLPPEPARCASPSDGRKSAERRSDTDAVWTPKQLEAPHAAPDKDVRVRSMFNAIARRYELVNSVFSLGRDRAWRQRAVDLARIDPQDRVLDIACGTGDFARAFARCRPAAVVGCDFAGNMLRLARSRNPGLSWIEADALRLPVGDASFTVTSCAFGVRNLLSLDHGFKEMRRVLAPGGRAVILEFGRPRNRWLRAAYEFYSHRVMPIGATVVSGDRSGAYYYLPRSVVSFLDSRQLVARLLDAGFARATCTPLTFGVVAVYVAYTDQD